MAPSSLPPRTPPSRRRGLRWVCSPEGAAEHRQAVKQSETPAKSAAKVNKCRRPDRILSPRRGFNLLLTYLAGVLCYALHPCLCYVSPLGFRGSPSCSGRHRGLPLQLGAWLPSSWEISGGCYILPRRPSRSAPRLISSRTMPQRYCACRCRSRTG